MMRSFLLSTCVLTLLISTGCPQEVPPPETTEEKEKPKEQEEVPVDSGNTATPPPVVDSGTPPQDVDAGNAAVSDAGNTEAPVTDAGFDAGSFGLPFGPEPDISDGGRVYMALVDSGTLDGGTQNDMGSFAALAAGLTCEGRYKECSIRKSFTCCQPDWEECVTSFVANAAYCYPKNKYACHLYGSAVKEWDFCGNAPTEGNTNECCNKDKGQVCVVGPSGYAFCKKDCTKEGGNPCPPTTSGLPTTDCCEKKEDEEGNEIWSESCKLLGTHPTTQEKFYGCKTTPASCDLAKEKYCVGRLGRCCPIGPPDGTNCSSGGPNAKANCVPKKFTNCSPVASFMNSAGECACDPVCSQEKPCGDDLCGGDCGTCDENQNEYCNDDTGQCETTPPCEPQCYEGDEGSPCGDDGCGGSCGGCLDVGTACNGGNITSGFWCGPCDPQCNEDPDKTPCGPDGCNGSCGECPNSDLSESELCQYDGTLAAPLGACAAFDAGGGNDDCVQNCTNFNLECGPNPLGSCPDCGVCESTEECVTSADGALCSIITGDDECEVGGCGDLIVTECEPNFMDTLAWASYTTNICTVDSLGVADCVPDPDGMYCDSCPPDGTIFSADNNSWNCQQ